MARYTKRLRVSSHSLSGFKEGMLAKLAQFKDYLGEEMVFSMTDKGDKIVIEESGKKAVQMVNSSTGERFAIIEPALSSIGVSESVCFRVGKIAGWVGLGICIKQEIKAKQFKFNHQKTGHSSYMISHNGYCWSHSD